MTTPGTPQTCKNTEKHGKMVFEIGGRFLAPRSAVEERDLKGFAAGVGPIGGGGGFASQLCRGLGLHIQHALLPLTEVRRIYDACGDNRPRTENHASLHNQFALRLRGMCYEYLSRSNPAARI